MATMTSTRHDRPRILFVDDDASVLTALARRLQPDRDRWNMVFVLGGQSALEEIARCAFDVVVSDYRMPEVDGFAVLAAARAACPSSATILLTGDANKVATSPAASALHRLLAKPCRTAELRAAIESSRAIAANQSAIARIHSAARVAALDNHSTLEQT